MSYASNADRRAFGVGGLSIGASPRYSPEGSSVHPPLVGASLSELAQVVDHAAKDFRVLVGALYPS